MNWADLNEIQPSQDFTLQKSSPLCFSDPSKKNSYSDIVKDSIPSNLAEDKGNIKIEDKEEKNQKDNKKKKRSNFCYTCKPRGKVLKHIIERSDLKGVVFHFDLHKRPLILVTPIKHYETIYNIPGPEILNIFEAIKIFCNEWNIKDYQVSYNSGEWQTHSHFHIKIKTSEKIINRLRRDHFLRLKLEQNYSKQPLNE